MFRMSLAMVGIAVVAAVSLAGAPATGTKTATSQATAGTPPPVAMSPTEQRAVLDKYCIACHSDRMRAGGLVLEKTQIDTGNVPQRADTWEKVVRKLHS